MLSTSWSICCANSTAALSGVLRPMVPPERWPPPNTENEKRLQIDAICDALHLAAPSG